MILLETSSKKFNTRIIKSNHGLTDERMTFAIVAKEFNIFARIEQRLILQFD
ncbi:MAG: hypothetical protein U0X93_08520 [Anaerolineales bacterium]